MLTLADVDLVRMVRTHQERVRIESRLAEHQPTMDLELDLQRMLEDPDAKVRHARKRITCTNQERTSLSSVD